MLATDSMLIFVRKFRGSGAAIFTARILPVMAGALVLASFAARPAAAQEGDVRINVGIAAAKPGDPIDIPLTLSGGENVQVGSILLHVGIPKKLLTYTDVERGLSVELADGEMKVTTSDDKADSSQILLEVSAAGKNCIKPGILGYLKFNVSTDAPKGVIDLKLNDSSATACPSGDMKLAKGDNGQLTIFALDETIPVVGCFFFSH